MGERDSKCLALVGTAVEQSGPSLLSSKRVMQRRGKIRGDAGDRIQGGDETTGPDVPSVQRWTVTPLVLDINSTRPATSNDRGHGSGPGDCGGLRRRIAGPRPSRSRSTRDQHEGDAEDHAKSCSSWSEARLGSAKAAESQKALDAAMTLQETAQKMTDEATSEIDAANEGTTSQQPQRRTWSQITKVGRHRWRWRRCCARRSSARQRR